MTLQQQEEFVRAIAYKFKAIFSPIGALDEAAVNDLIEQYLIDHPDTVMTDSEVNTLIAEYIQNHPIDTMTDGEVNVLIETYLTDHPVGGDTYLSIPITHTDQVVQRIGLTDSQVRASVSDEINNNLGDRLQDITSVGNVYVTNYVALYNRAAPITNNTVWKDPVTSTSTVTSIHAWYVVNLFDGRWFVSNRSSSAYILSLNTSNELVVDYTFPNTGASRSITPDGKRAIIGDRIHELQEDGTYLMVQQTDIFDTGDQAFMYFDGLKYEVRGHRFGVQQDGTWSSIGGAIVTDSDQYYTVRYSPDHSIVLKYVYSGSIVQVKEWDGTAFVVMPSITLPTDYKNTLQTSVTWDKQKVAILAQRKSDNAYVILTYYKRDDASNEWNFISANSTPVNDIASNILLMTNDGSKVITTNSGDHTIVFEQKDIFAPALDANDPDPFGDGSLIAKYLLNGDATDLLGNHDGVWTGNEAYEAGKFSNSATGDGNSYIVSGVDISGTHTSSVWFKTTLSNNDIPILDNATQRHYMRAGVNGVHNVSTYNTALNDGVWHHLVYVMEAGNEIAYLDGTSIGAIDTAISYGSDLRIGEDRANGRFTGAIDHVEIFNRALTAEEVSKLYEAAEGGSINEPEKLLNSDLANDGTVVNDWTLDAEVLIQTNSQLNMQADQSSGGALEDSSAVVTLHQDVTIPAGDYTLRIDYDQYHVNASYNNSKVWFNYKLLYTDGTNSTGTIFYSYDVDNVSEQTIPGVLTMLISAIKEVSGFELYFIYNTYETVQSSGGVDNYSQIYLNSVSIK